MMVVMFLGLGVASLLTGFASGPYQMAAGLFLMGGFAAIHHPVGIALVSLWYRSGSGKRYRRWPGTGCQRRMGQYGCRRSTAAYWGAHGPARLASSFLYSWGAVPDERCGLSVAGADRGLGLRPRERLRPALLAASRLCYWRSDSRAAAPGPALLAESPG